MFTKTNRKFVFVLVFVVLVAAQLACGGGSGCGDTISMQDARCAGGQIVETISTGRTDAEQAVHNLLGCNPETALYGCNADGSFK